MKGSNWNCTKKPGIHLLFLLQDDNCVDCECKTDINQMFTWAPKPCSLSEEASKLCCLPKNIWNLKWCTLSGAGL